MRLQDIAESRKDNFMIALDLISEDLYNPRENFESVPDLAISMFNAGQLEACEVRMSPEGDKVILTAGHRRLRAAKYVNEHYDQWTKEGATGVRFYALLCKSEPKGMVRQIHQGGDRIFQPLNPIELAKAYKRLMDDGWTFARIAQSVGKSAQAIANTMQVLKAPQELQDAAERGDISATAAQRAAKASPEKQQAAVDAVKAGKKVKEKDLAQYVPLTIDEARKVISRARQFCRDEKSQIGQTKWNGLIHGIEIAVGLRPVEF
jgi:ParB family chromosome partitioning protein